MSENESQLKTDAYLVRIPCFEGPFDLLFDLLEKDQIDIWDIPIAKITSDYLDYLTSWQEMQLDIAVEFFLLAAELIEIKLAMLLPEDSEEQSEGPEGPDPRLELAQRLALYRRFRQAAGTLRDMLAKGARYYRRPTVPSPPGPPVYEQRLGNVTAEDLAKLTAELVDAWQERKRVRKLTRHKIDVGRKIVALMTSLRNGKPLRLRDFLGEGADRSHIVATFLAVLELVKRGKIDVQTRGPRDIIMIPLQEQTQG